jgi:hypothetical protein
MARNSVVMPFAGVLDHLYVYSVTPPGAGETIDITVMINGAPSALTVQLAGAAQTAGSDLVNAVAVAAGDLVVIRYVSSLNAAQAGCVASVRLRG